MKRSIIALSVSVGLLATPGVAQAADDGHGPWGANAPEVIHHSHDDDHGHEHSEREYSELDLAAAQSSWDKWDRRTFPKSTSVKLGDQFQVRAYKSSALWRLGDSNP